MQTYDALPAGAGKPQAMHHVKHEAFGSDVPLAEPSWYQNLNTPFYNASHVAWRAKLRDFFEKEVEPIVDDWDKQAVQNNHAKCGEYVKRMYQKSAQYGILPACVGKPWPRGFTNAPEPEGYDYFHELINGGELGHLFAHVSNARLVAEF